MNTSSVDQAVASPVTAFRIILHGRVQGVGYRPAIARLAQALNLTGWVKNTGEGVEVHVEGSLPDAARFVDQCEAICPRHAAVIHRSVGLAIAESGRTFRILQDQCPGALAVPVPLDLVTCSECLAEVEEVANRRADYVFTSCTNCGPRYSVIEAMPYERAATTMNGFPLCEACEAEFTSPADRRYHAQATACAACGPQWWSEDNAVTALRSGQILAMKGLGGYQLLVDATSPEAIQRLRHRKSRAAKPFAVLVSDLDEALRLADLSPIEREVLASPAGPIVVARLRPHHLAANVSPHLSTVGLLLPTTPLHRLISRSCGPLVATSGNREGEPLAFEESTVESSLSDIADLFVHHNRPIRHPIDDSVVRVMAGRSVTLRLGRGLAPLSLAIPASAHAVENQGQTVSTGLSQVLAVGAQQKVALALSNDRQAVLGPHIGDLDALAARQHFVDHVADFLALYRAEPSVVVHDLHPDYFTTNWAADWAKQRQLRTIAVQHHHAHVVAGMVEQGWLSNQVLGVAWDGTGWGPDGTIWGGEFLLATATGFQRVAHLRPFSLPGGQAAIREPWRVAAAILRDVRDWDSTVAFDFPREAVVLPLLNDSRFSPVTTSAGRLFDAVAALILPRELLGNGLADYEGQFAVLLEDVCREDATGRYPFPWVTTADKPHVGMPPEDTQPRVLDWRPLVSGVLHDFVSQVPIGTIAMRFHRSIAAGIADVCRCFAHLPVVLGGGVFQNRVLLELLAEEFSYRGAPVGFPGVIPPNDGGLAAGQLAIGLATLEAERRCV